MCTALVTAHSFNLPEVKILWCPFITHLHQIGNTASLLLGYNECSHLHSWSSTMVMSEWLPLSCIHIYYVPCSPIYILFFLLGFVIFSFAIPLFPTVRPRISDLCFVSVPNFDPCVKSASPSHSLMLCFLFYCLSPWSSVRCVESKFPCLIIHDVAPWVYCSVPLSLFSSVCQGFVMFSKFCTLPIASLFISSIKGSLFAFVCLYKISHKPRAIILNLMTFF